VYWAIFGVVMDVSSAHHHAELARNSEDIYQSEPAIHLPGRFGAVLASVQQGDSAFGPPKRFDVAQSSPRSETSESSLGGRLAVFEAPNVGVPGSYNSRSSQSALYGLICEGNSSRVTRWEPWRPGSFSCCSGRPRLWSGVWERVGRSWSSTEQVRTHRHDIRHELLLR